MFDVDVAELLSVDADKELDEEKPAVCSSSSAVTSAEATSCSKYGDDLHQEETKCEDEEVAGWEKDVTSEEKEKAVEMGLRIGLIEDEETEKLYGPLLTVSATLRCFYRFPSFRNSDANFPRFCDLKVPLEKVIAAF